MASTAPPRPPGIPIPTGTKELQLTLTMCGEFPCIVAQVNWIQIFTDIIEGLIELFTGRPKDEATQQSAKAAMGARNPAYRLYGMQLQRMMSQWGIVTSDSNPGRRKILDAAYSQAVDNGLAMGFGRREIEDGLLWILSREGQAGTNVPAIVNKTPVTPMVLWGQPTIEETFLKAQGIATSRGLVLGDFDRWVERYTWQHAKLTGLFHVVFVKQGDIPPLKCSKGYEWNYSVEECTPTASHQKCPSGFTYNEVTGNCDPIIPPGPQNCPAGTVWNATFSACVPVPVHGKCPDGYLYNATTDSCDPNVPPPPPACPAGQQWNEEYQVCAPVPQKQQCPVGYGYNNFTNQCDPLTPPQTGPDDACCTAVTAQLQAIAQSLAAIGQSTAAGPDSAAILQVVAAIGDVTLELTNILNTITIIANAPQTPIDLKPITDALNAFGACLCELPGLAAESTTQLSGAIAQIADAIRGIGGADLTGVVDQLAKIFTTIDPKPEIYSLLTTQGFIAGDVAQLAGAGDLGTGLVGILGTLLWRGVVQYVKFWLGIDISSALPKLGAGTSAEALLTDAIGRTLSSEEKIVTPVLTPLLDSIKNLLVPTATPKLGNVNVDPDRPIAAATGVALTAGLVAYLASFAGIDEGEPLAHLAELIAGAIGWEELRDVQIGPLVRHGIQRVAEMKAKAAFRQELPGTSAVAALLARDLVDRTTYDLVAGYDGLAVELTEPTRLGAYEGLNPRILMRLVDTGLFADADIADELTFSGMRPASQHRFLLAAAFMATDPQRKGLIAQIEAAYQAGLLSDDQLLSNVDSAEHNTDKANLILAAAKWKLLIAETKLLETEYATLFRGGLIDDATYRSYLAGLQLQPGLIDIRAGLVEAQANASLHRKSLAEAAKLEDQTKRDARRTAMKSFADGLINELTLGAQLIATGLSPQQVLAWVALATLEKAGSAKWLFGLQLQPERASLLRERVLALTDQRKRQLITDAQFVEALKALGIPAKYLNAMRAAADALVSPKTAATRVIVETT